METQAGVAKEAADLCIDSKGCDKISGIYDRCCTGAQRFEI